MKKVYWEIRKYDYKHDEVDTLFEGKKAQAIARFKKLKNTENINYVLNRWVAYGYWGGSYSGWDFEDYELDEQWEGGEYL